MPDYHIWLPHDSSASLARLMASWKMNRSEAIQFLIAHAALTEAKEKTS